jgi:hypothetical protein
MDYLAILVGLIGIIIGLLLNRSLPSYFSKKGENLATKEDIGKITKEMEEIKNIYQNKYDLSKVEREFYNNMVAIIYEFSAEIKKYEFKENTVVTKEIVLGNESLKQEYFEFIDSANELLGKAFVFLGENNYTLLKEAVDTSINFDKLTKNLLDAMRKSIHANTKLTSESDIKDLHYK